MSKEKIKIKEILVRDLSCELKVWGEYESSVSVDFILENPCTFNAFGINYVIDRIKMTSDGEGVYLVAAGNRKTFKAIEIPKNYINAVLCKVLKEQKKGKSLDGWSFEEDLIEMLQCKEDTQCIF